MKLSIVIPARHEGINAVTTHGEIKSLLLQQGIENEIIVIYDDGEPHGFGLAVRRGLERCSGEAICIVMADGSDSPADIVDYFRILELGYDCAFGTRFLTGYPKDYPWPKLILNRVANTLIRWLFSIDNNDVTNAFKMYRREVIEALQPLESEQFDLTVEMPLKAYSKGFKIAHPPITWTNRRHGKSKWKISELASPYIRRVLKIWWNR